MVRKPRDYRAEYARRKARADEAGVTVRQSYNIRNRLGISNRAPLPTDASLRAEARKWSKEHSHVPTSRFKSRMGVLQLVDYQHTFMRNKGKKGRKVRHDIWEYLTKWEGLDEPWTENWVSPNAR